MACIICSDPIDFSQRSEYNCVTEKGLATINDINKIRDIPSIQFASDLYVHSQCRLKHIRRNVSDPPSNDVSQSLRSTSQPFDYKTQCLFCTRRIDLEESRKRKRDSQWSHLRYSRVMVLEFQKRVIEKCVERNDAWAASVHSRLSCINDLPAEEAMYHWLCQNHFHSAKGIPSVFSDEQNVGSCAGRPRDDTKHAAFQLVIDYLEANDNETLTLEDLYHIMESGSGLSSDQLFSERQMKRELEDHYGPKVSITTIHQQPNIVTLTSNAKSIIHRAHKEAMNAKDSSMTELIQVVGEFIRMEIKSTPKHTNVYPDADDMRSKTKNLAYLPPSLRTLLQTIIKSSHSDLHVASLGQAIMQTTCPRSFLPPLQVGLCVTVEHKYGHRCLLDLLSKMGLCSSYSESDRYRRNAAATQGVDLRDEIVDTFVQYQADNVDHATRTLNGSGTVHVMGQMAGFTPGIKFSRKVKRANVTIDDIKKIGQVKLVPQVTKPDTAKSSIVYTKLGAFTHDGIFPKVDTLWRFSLHHRAIPRPSWSGTMKMLHRDGEHPGKSSEMFLPIIDLTPSDPMCVRSTLEYVTDHAVSHGYTPVLTFDQQLWWIAYMVIETEPNESPLRQIVLMLGGFHTQMSFLGAIGSLMAGSGLREAISQVYPDGSIDQMLTGKAVSRSVRAHMLLDSALNTLATSAMLHVPIPTISDLGHSDNGAMEHQDSGNDPDNDESQILHDLDVDHVTDDGSDILDINDQTTDPHVDGVSQNPDVDEVHSWIDTITDLLNNDSDIEQIKSSDVLTQLQDKLQNWLQSMQLFRTAKLWTMYMDMVSILRSFLYSSRTGNWKLYIESLHNMLPFLAASGHNNYVKSLMLFLARMEKLETTHPRTFARFNEGYFVLRRSDDYWCGIFSDLFIEQVLMGSIKSVGGLSRGRGFDESTRLVWLLSTPACGEIEKAMFELACADSSGKMNEVMHRDLMKTSIARDAADTQLLLNYLVARNPFTTETNDLRSLSSGVIAEEKVNVDEAETIGTSIVDAMIGMSVRDHKFRKKDQVVTLASSVYVMVDNEKIEIHPQQLYQRLLVAGNGRDLDELFRYELCPYPASLFDSKLLMRVGDKSDLMHGVVKRVPECVVEELPGDVVYVIDGGSLLQKLPWPKSITYHKLCDLYIQYLERHYPRAIVVFDGYGGGPTTKDETHQRRIGKEMGVDVDVRGDMLLEMKKKSFLANPRNKQKFINLLGSLLSEQPDIQVQHAEGDADYDIVISACTISMTQHVAIVGEDTDLLMLLLHHHDPHNLVFMKTSTRVINLSVLKQGLGDDISSDLLFIHAMTGCDTTSRPYGIGKVSSLKKSDSLHSAAQIFMEQNKSVDEIDEAGSSALMILYGIKDESIDVARVARFNQKVVTASSYIPPERLPPTEDATRYHSRRVYHQVQTWLGNVMAPTEWGWDRQTTSRSVILKPHRMDQDAAPLDVLKIIRCNCSGRCVNNMCSCRKNGLLCGPACGHCKGITCANGPETEVDETPDT